MRVLTLLALLFSAASMYMCWAFQTLAQGPNGSFSHEWYWGGAISAYALALFSFFFIFYKFLTFNLEQFDQIVRLLSFVFCLISIFLTSFFVIAGQSGF